MPNRIIHTYKFDRTAEHSVRCRVILVNDYYWKMFVDANNSLSLVIIVTKTIFNDAYNE